MTSMWTQVNTHQMATTTCRHDRRFTANSHSRHSGDVKWWSSCAGKKRRL